MLQLARIDDRAGAQVFQNPTHSCELCRRHHEGKLLSVAAGFHDESARWFSIVIVKNQLGHDTGCEVRERNHFTSSPATLYPADHLSAPRLVSGYARPASLQSGSILVPGRRLFRTVIVTL
jgi:hypothetical protein